MTEKKLLVNLSNHPHEKWSAEQKAGWDVIIDIPFPQIPAIADAYGIVSNYITPIMGELGKIAREHPGEALHIMLQGEFTFCYLLRDILLCNFENDTWTFVIPTTERKVKETVRPDGTVEKNAIFEFVRWRFLK